MNGSSSLLPLSQQGGIEVLQKEIPQHTLMEFHHGSDENGFYFKTSGTL